MQRIIWKKKKMQVRETIRFQKELRFGKTAAINLEGVSKELKVRSEVFLCIHHRHVRSLISLTPLHHTERFGFSEYYPQHL